MKTVFWSLICRFKDHKWRKLRKAEKAASPDPTANERVCDRCHVVRQVKNRKVSNGND